MTQNFYLGIDVSKGYADFILLDSEKEVVEENFQIDDTDEGHKHLYKFISGFLAKNKNARIFAGLESTGGYEDNWYGSLIRYSSKLNLSVARLNPFGVHYNSKAALKRVITDKESARNVARYLIGHADRIRYNEEDRFSTLKRQWTFIKMLTKQKVQLLNQLEGLLYIANPELLKYCRGKVNTWILQLLGKYPTAKELAKAKGSSLAKIPFITADKADELIDAARQSVASRTDNTTASIIAGLAEQILRLRKLIKLNTKLLEESCNNPEVELLKTFYGIGTISAVGLMIEIVSVNRFDTVKKLAGFFGVHPSFKQSGDGKTMYRMSKRGRKEPRQILFNIARFAIARNPYIKEIYASHLKKGMPKMAALGAIMHKILRMVFGMLKNGTPYNPDTDKGNRERHIHEVKSAKPDLLRRFQKRSLDAPVSRRQSKKRKEQEKSQTSKPFETAQIIDGCAGSDSRSSHSVTMKT